MTSKRPTIGVTGPDAGGSSAWLFTARAVRRAGGRPLRIRPGKPRAIEKLDGLIVGGGADVEPSLYGQERLPHLDEIADGEGGGARRLLNLLLFPVVFAVRRLLVTKTTGLDDARDRLEKRLIREGLRRGMPILGICRGMQLLNVVAGGDLHQSLEGFYEEHPQLRSVLPRKTIAIAPGSRLARVLGTTEARVNALHSQAIDRLGAGLRVCAREKSGVIQAIEHGHARLVLGVQWHPEYLPQLRQQQALFAALVQVADERRMRASHEDAVDGAVGEAAEAELLDR
jgi:putative glutamine amidotransferase